jgi:hypothetical protein
MNTHTEFRNAYVATLLWSNYNGESEMEQYFDEIANGFADFDAASQGQIEKDCKRFLELSKGLFKNKDCEQAGHDFALTRNGHGVGFWDRPEVYGKANADKLTDIAESFSEVYLLWNGDTQKVGIE